jgi:hypothetical protein
MLEMLLLLVRRSIAAPKSASRSYDGSWSALMNFLSTVLLQME